MFYRLAVGTVKGGEGLMALVLDYLQRQNIQCITVDDGKGEDGGTDEIMIPAAVAEKVAGGAADGGIIIDSWGIGGSVTVNKFRGCGDHAVQAPPLPGIQDAIMTPTFCAWVISRWVHTCAWI